MLGGNILMKASVRVLTVGLFALLLTVTLASSAFAQGQECDQNFKTSRYQTYIDNYNSNNIADLEKAVAAAEEYVKVCANDGPSADIVKYLSDAVPTIKKRIGEIQEKIKRDKLIKEENARFARFDKAYTAKNWGEVFAAGAEILSHPPVKKNVQLDMRILLASRGSVLAESGNNEFNNETLKYAKEAISRINAGEDSTSGEWGAYDFSWKTKDNALGQLNYAIGYIDFYPKDDKEEGIAYYYKATQYDSDTRKYTPIYVTLGDWYREKAGEIGEKRKALDLTEAAGDQREANIKQAEAYFAMEKAYVQRAMDAYARAYNIAKSDKNATAEFKTNLFNTLKTLFQFRYSRDTPEDAAKRTDESINSYVASVSTESLPNPANDPAPIVEKKPDAGDKATDGSNEGTSSDTTGRARTVGKSTAKKTGN